MRFVSVASELAAFAGRAGPAPHAWRPTCAVALLAFLFFAWLAPAAMPSGDAALYAQQARYLELGERTVHIGYFVVAAAFTLFQSQAPDLAFNLLSALFGAAIVGLVSHVTSLFTGRLDLGVLAGLSLCGSSTFLRQAAWAEVYAGQAFFFLLALWLVLLSRPAWAGLALAASLLFSPSTLLGVPCLALARPRLRAIVTLGVAGGSVVLAVLAFVWRDYFFGPRGLFGAAPTAGGPTAAVVKEGFEVLYGVTALLPFLAAGCWALLQHRLGRYGLALLAALWAPTFLFGERYPDVPVQLPTWILLAPILVAGLAWLEERLVGATAVRRSLLFAGATGAAVLPLLAVPVVATRSQAFAQLGTELVAGLITLCVVAAALAFWLCRERPRAALHFLFAAWTLCGVVLGARLVSDQNAGYVAYRAQVLELRSAAAADYLAIGSWEQGILLEHYLYGRPYTGRTLDLAALRREDVEAETRLRAALEQGHEIWLLQPDDRLEQQLRGAGRDLRPAVGFWVASPAEKPAEEPAAETMRLGTGEEA